MNFISNAAQRGTNITSGGDPIAILRVCDLFLLHAALRTSELNPAALRGLKLNCELLSKICRKEHVGELECSDLLAVAEVLKARGTTRSHRIQVLSGLSEMLLTAKLESACDDSDLTCRMDDCAGVASAMAHEARNCGPRES